MRYTLPTSPEFLLAYYRQQKAKDRKAAESIARSETKPKSWLDRLIGWVDGERV